MNDIAIIIPSFNEGERLIRTLETLRDLFITAQPHPIHIVIVDDASTTPISEDALARITMPPGSSLTMLRHPLNLGQGAALQTGLSYALAVTDSTFFVTMDADGQHSAESIPALLEPLRADTADIVFGSRFTGAAHGLPRGRSSLLKLATMFERRLTGLVLTDAHNGFRAFNRRVAEHVNLRQNRMAHATELKQIVARLGVRYCEVPVSITYTEDSLAKGQRNRDSLLILKDLVKSYLFHG